METHTLTEEQAKDLGEVLSTHISNNMPVGEQGKSLLVKLQRLEPNQDQKYAILYASPEEEEVFQALINSHWPKVEVCQRKIECNDCPDRSVFEFPVCRLRKHKIELDDSQLPEPAPGAMERLLEAVEPEIAEEEPDDTSNP